MSTPEARAAWLADVRRVMDAVEAHPALPLPYARDDGIEFYLLDTISAPSSAPRLFSDVERTLTEALGVTLAGRRGDEGKPGEGKYYLLEGHLPGGTRIAVRAWADAVAEKRVTGTRIVEDVEWVRLPVRPDPEPAGDDQGDEENDEGTEAP